jgi:tetratricopeptide (TPR) repeat protein
MKFVTQTAGIFFCALLFGWAGERAFAQPLAQEAAQLLDRAQASLHRGDWQAAVPSLEQALAKEPKHKGARSALISTLLRLNRIADAEKHASIFAEQFPAETEPVFLRALIAFQQGQIPRVAELTAQCLKRGDNRAEVYKLSAIAEYLLGNQEKFVAHIRAAIKQNPKDADAHYHLGRHYFEIKRYNDALASFQTVTQIQPEHYKAHYYAGLVYEGQNEMEKAKEQYRAAIQTIDRVKIPYAWPFTDLGKLLVNEGDAERGVGWLYRGVRNDPASPHAWYGYAKALFKQEASSEVKEALAQAIRLDPGHADALYLLARYYQKTGEQQLAKDTFARFEELKKNPAPSPYGLRRW